MIELIDSIFAHEINDVVSRFSERLTGDVNAHTLVLYTEDLRDEAREALAKSAQALDLHPEFLFAQIAGLDELELYTLIEGIDPVYLIASDEIAATLLTLTYHEVFQRDCTLRVQGRNAVLVCSLNDSVSDREKKPALWQLLKTLPSL